MVDKARVENIINQWVALNDCFLVEVKTSPGKVIVFIDKPAGVTLDECIKLNKHLTNELEAEGTWETNELEVSSPGMEQPLRVYQQYLRRLGREIKVITKEGREHKGKLQTANQSGIELLEIISRKENKKKLITEVVHQFDYNNIKETKLILSFKI